LYEIASRARHCQNHGGQQPFKRLQINQIVRQVVLGVSPSSPFTPQPLWLDHIQLEQQPPQAQAPLVVLARQAQTAAGQHNGRGVKRRADRADFGEAELGRDEQQRLDHMQLSRPSDGVSHKSSPRSAAADNNGTAASGTGTVPIQNMKSMQSGDTLSSSSLNSNSAL
jgi:hypothetical protein